MRKLTEGTTSEGSPSISADGRKLVYGSNVPGHEDIWLKDLETGKETAVANTDAGELHPTISRDGSMIAYTVDEAKLRALYVVPSDGGKPAQVGAVSGFVFDWTPDKLNFVFHTKTFDPYVKRLNLQTRVVSDFLGKPKFNVFQTKFSPDGEWLAFLGITSDEDWRIFLVKMRNGSPGEDWIRVSDEHGLADKPRWSPDGNTIYFISHRDGFRCLWAQRLDPRTKHPVSDPFAIHHFHQSRLSLMNVGPLLEIDVAKDKIVMNLGELTGNIWSLNQR